MRTANRSPVTLKIKFKSSTLEQFIERYSVDISHGGIFIRTKDPLPVGTNLRFEFQLKDASPLITGDGTVVWTRDFDPTRSGVAPGMGVRFDRLPSESQDVLDQILTHKTTKLGKAETSFLETPTKVAFGNVPTRVTPKEMLEGLAQGEGRRTGKDDTPLPHPLPFHNELDEFPDEAFEEATKVAALDGLARRSAHSEDGGNETPFGKSLEEDVTQERPGRPAPRATPQSVNAREAAREAARDTDAAAGQAAVFHDLPSRPPFAQEGERAEAKGKESNGARPDGADPFALDEQKTGVTAPSRRSAAALRVVEPEPEPEDDLGLSDLPPGEGDDDAATGESDEPATRVVAEARPLAARAEADNSSMPWIAAAAVLLLIGGIGGFWLLSGRSHKGEAGQPPDRAPPAATRPAPAAPAPAASASEPAQPAAPAVLEVTLVTRPEGAVAELVGGSQSGPTPMTFRGLTGGQSYTVKVSKAGFVTAELTMKPEAGDPPPVQLVAKKAVLRVSSEPAGAQVSINGRRQRQVTPVDVELPARATERKRVTLSVRKNGFVTVEQQVALTGMVDKGDTMVQEVSLVLDKRPTPPPEAEDEDDESGEDEGKASAGKDAKEESGKDSSKDPGKDSGKDSSKPSGASSSEGGKDGAGGDKTGDKPKDEKSEGGGATKPDDKSSGATGPSGTDSVSDGAKQK